MAVYLSLAGFQARTVMPVALAARLETERPGWTLRRATHWSAWVEARLGKRYNVPFPAWVDAMSGSPPAPTGDPVVPSPPWIVIEWVTRLVTKDAYGALGFSPTSAQDQAQILDPVDGPNGVYAQAKEAADSVTGLFDLPLAAENPAASGIARGGPLSYSETSPYVAFDDQFETGIQEDMSRGR